MLRLSHAQTRCHVCMPTRTGAGRADHTGVGRAVAPPPPLFAPLAHTLRPVPWSLPARGRFTNLLCPAGKYRLAGSAACLACPAGTLGTFQGLVSMSGNCSGECPAGTYSLGAASRCTPCPAGRFGNATRTTSAVCAGSCSPGFACPPGSTSPTPAHGECPLGYTSTGRAGWCVPAGNTTRSPRATRHLALPGPAYRVAAGDPDEDGHRVLLVVDAAQRTLSRVQLVQGTLLQHSTGHLNFAQYSLKDVFAAGGTGCGFGCWGRVGYWGRGDAGGMGKRQHGGVCQCRTMVRMRHAASRVRDGVQALTVTPVRHWVGK